ncbi:MAG: diacylglycerol kinase family protein [Nanoarchaeota archaeon]|nr:diacylglycerol kinase family protein [Nanoarchaeota archaeon]MBU1320985.1 diacylglycerol kinase family protein [Nanoarchaeota archaeon]MBU1598370.1 diacylglycerol kinase family protein [Nanoarchaeota archaeon]MBU2441728.1 diacylglycerol kinase family protein [Nanoarchaeota archaeon]
MKKNKFSKSVGFALRGIAEGISSERNIKIQIIIGMLVLLLAILLQFALLEIIIILVVSFLVIITELMNTAVEKLIDFLHPKQHKEIGRVKDILAGAVLLSVVLSIIVGILLFFNPIINLIRII